jgi:hypothetical protein
MTEMTDVHRLFESIESIVRDRFAVCDESGQELDPAATVEDDLSLFGGVVDQQQCLYPVQLCRDPSVWAGQ